MALPRGLLLEATNQEGVGGFPPPDPPSPPQRLTPSWLSGTRGTPAQPPAAPPCAPPRSQVGPSPRATAWARAKKGGCPPPTRLCPPCFAPFAGCLNCSHLGELTARLATLEAQVSPPAGVQPPPHLAVPPLRGHRNPGEVTLGRGEGCPPHCGTQLSRLVAR